MSKLSWVLIALLILSVSIYSMPISSALDTTTLSAGADSRMNEAAPNTNYGAVNVFWVSGGPGDNNGIIWFNLSSLDGFAIDSAFLQLTYGACVDGIFCGVDSQPIRVHEVDTAANWNETEVTWNNRTAAILWASGGGDYNSTYTDRIIVGPAIPSDWNWTVTYDVKRWVEEGRTNNGWIITGEDVTPQLYFAFGSKENANPAVRPVLFVNYGYNLTQIFHSGIAEVRHNGSSVANNTATIYGSNEIANITSILDSPYSFFRYEFDSNHTHTSPYFHNMTGHITFEAYALQTGSVSGVSVLLIAVVGAFSGIVILVASRKR